MIANHLINLPKQSIEVRNVARHGDNPIEISGLMRRTTLRIQS